MSSDAQRKAASRYLATKKTVTIRFDPTEAVAVSTAAAAAGESTQGYILTAVRQRMDRDASASKTGLESTQGADGKLST